MASFDQRGGGELHLSEAKAYVAPSSSAGMVDIGFLAVGALMVAGGGLWFNYATRIATFQERLDAIGSTTPAGDVEAAGWRVAFTKLTGALFVAVGVLFLASALVG
jgi:hypothetical protein